VTAYRQSRRDAGRDFDDPAGFDPDRGPRESARPELVHVSIGLREDGGGAAHYGRLLGRALRRLAARRGFRFRGLHFASSDGGPALDGYVSFRGSRARLGIEVLALQTLGRGRRLLVFDHPGPARAQGFLPRWARSLYAVALLGIDAWREPRPAARRALAGAHRLLPISRVTLERARAFLPADAPAVVVHPGLDTPHPGGAPDHTLLGTLGSGFALIVSRLAASERYKGHDELLEAWPALTAYLPDSRLVVVGDGDDRRRLEDEVRRRGLSGAVRFTGFVDSATLAELYRRAALFVMPSTDEGFGLVFLEAMAAGKPCIALAGTAPAEIVVDGETGRLVERGDRRALAAALGELLGNRELAARLGAAGRDRFEREFRFESFERRLEAALAPLLALAPASAGAGGD
jgi:phosphatidylinositol alpha-1,6-mannosyltransferase